MKKLFVITTALAICSALMPAFGADFRVADRPAEAPVFVQCDPFYGWTGFYIGGHVGGAFSGNNNFSDGYARSSSDTRFLGGLQVGADYQFAPNWLIGVEGQYSWLTGRTGATFPNDIAYTNEQSGLGSIAGRAGYTWGRGLIYVKGGYAYSSNKEQVTSSSAPFGFEMTGDHRNGWTVGAGLELLLTKDWSAKVEYQYYNFGKATFVTPALGEITSDDNTLKLGVNYRFGWGG